MYAYGGKEESFLNRKQSNELQNILQVSFTVEVQPRRELKLLQPFGVFCSANL
jgi:hypothetical protein